jgi:hypothetical protein
MFKAGFPIGRTARNITLSAYFFFMFIGRLDSWQSPECSRDLRFE